MTDAPILLLLGFSILESVEYTNLVANTSVLLE